MKIKQSTIIFHIGFHKTGSTSLQQYFAENEAALQIQGIRFPLAARERNPRQIIHSNLPWQLLNHGKFDSALKGIEELAQEVQARPGAWVVTTEGLSRLADASSIKDSFPDANIKTIAYCRNPLHAAPSLYTEQLKFGATKTWSLWADSANLSEWFDYGKKLAPWRSIGSEVMLRHLTNVRQIKESGLSIFEDFVSLLPGPIETSTLNMSFRPEANSRLSLLECAALYAVNHALKKTAEQVNENQKVSFRNTARRVVRSLFPEFLHPFALSALQQNQLQETLCQLGLLTAAGHLQEDSGESIHKTIISHLNNCELDIRKVFRRSFPPSLPIKVTKFLQFLEDAMPARLHQDTDLTPDGSQ